MALVVPMVHTALGGRGVSTARSPVAAATGLAAFLMSRPATVRVCSAAGCPELTTIEGRCALHRREAEVARGRRQTRGYDTEHDATRRRLLPDAYGRPCPRCGLPMLPTQPLDLGHTVPLRVDPTSRADRIEHASCNRAARD